MRPAEPAASEPLPPAAVEPTDRDRTGWLAGIRHRLAALSPRRLFLTLYALFFAMLLAWGIGTPLQQSPDEWAHLFRAAGIYHGQVLISARGAMDPVLGDPVRVPAWLVADRNAARCFMHHTTVAVSCSHPASSGTSLVQSHTPAARYPPFYYLAVGWPLLFSHGNLALYLMRVVAAALSAAMLAWGMTAAVRLGAGLAATGVVVAVTPMVGWLSTMINPNGLEIAAAVCLWPQLVLWVSSVEPRARRAGAVGAAVAAASMVLSRSVSIVWVGVAIASVLPLLRLSWLRAELRRRSSLLAAGAVVLAGLVSLVWSAAARQTQLGQLRRPVNQRRQYGLWHNMHAAYRLLARWWHQAIGNFGWLDTQVSLRTIHLFDLAGVVLIVAAVVFGLWSGRRSALCGAAIAAALTIVVTLYLDASVANDLTLNFWQGRYSIPMGVGVPVLLGFAARSRGGWQRWPAGLASLVISALIAAITLKSFVLFFRRNSVGVHQPIQWHGGWQPPGGIVVWLVLLTLSLVGLAVVAVAGATGVVGIRDGLDELAPVEQAASAG